VLFRSLLAISSQREKDVKGCGAGLLSSRRRLTSTKALSHVPLLLFLLLLSKEAAAVEAVRALPVRTLWLLLLLLLLV
jgi:hypothetical protein